MGKLGKSAVSVSDALAFVGLPVHVTGAAHCFRYGPIALSQPGIDVKDSRIGAAIFANN